MIHHLRNSEIDRRLYDAVARQSGRPYQLSWWLDTVSPGWEALIEDNYKAVMPLPVKQRYGLRYIVQPLFTQQLGLIGSTDIEAFVHAIPYLSYDFNLNHDNHYAGPRSIEHVNYIIRDREHYDQNAKRNIRQAERLTYEKLSAEQFMKLWRQYAKANDPNHNQLLEQLTAETERRDMAITGGAFLGSELVAALFAVATEARIITLAPVSAPEGRAARAMFGLMDNLISRSEGRIIDCEGSMIEGVARFYRSMGGREENYQRIWRLSPRKKR